MVQCQPKGGSKQPSLIAPTEILTVPQPHRILSSLISMSQYILGGSLPDDAEINHGDVNLITLMSYHRLRYLVIKTYNKRYVQFVLSIEISLEMSCWPHQLRYLHLILL